MVSVFRDDVFTKVKLSHTLKYLYFLKSKKPKLYDVSFTYLRVHHLFALPFRIFLFEVCYSCIVIYFANTLVVKTYFLAIVLEPSLQGQKTNGASDEIKCDRNKKGIQLAWLHCIEIILHGFGWRIPNK